MSGVDITSGTWLARCGCSGCVQTTAPRLGAGTIIRCECGKLHIWGQSCSCGVR